MNRLFCLLLFIAFFVACTSRKDTIGNLFLKDANHDGRVTVREAMEDSVLVRKWDMNHDGYVTMTEAAGLPSQEDRSVENQFKQLDRDGNGAIDSKEYPMAEMIFLKVVNKGSFRLAEAPEMFKQLEATADSLFGLRGGWALIYDLNGDGHISRQEFDFVVGADSILVGDLNVDGITTYGEASEVEEPLERWRPIRASVKILEGFTRFDKNNDERLERLELGKSSYLIPQLDINADTVLSKEELVPAASFERVGPTAYRNHVSLVRFTRMDINKDSVLTGKELGRWVKVVELLDKDGNKMVTLNEFKDRAEAWKALRAPLIKPKESDSH